MLHTGHARGAPGLLLARPVAATPGRAGRRCATAARATTPIASWPCCWRVGHPGGARSASCFEDFIDTFFRRSAVGRAACSWWWARWSSCGRPGRPARPRVERPARWRGAAIGVAQALALFPGISRSGITIAAGLFLGLERAAAARFAFLMGTPIIAGAGLWKMRELVVGAAGCDRARGPRGGVIAAAICGLLAIGFLLRYLRNHTSTSSSSIGSGRRPCSPRSAA